MPVTEVEVHEMEQRIAEYKEAREYERNSMAQQSKAGTKAKAPQVTPMSG